MFRKKNFILIILAIISLLRLLSFNSYVNLFTGLGILLFSILGVILFIKHLWHKEMCEIFPFAILLMILYLLIFGLIDILLFGLISLVILSIGSFVYFYIKDDYEIKDLLSTGVVFICISTIILLVANYMIQFDISDEYTFWSIASKNMYLSNTMHFSKLNYMPIFLRGEWYPPVPTVFYCYSMKIMGMYRQGLELLIMQILCLSLMIPLFKYTKTRLQKVCLGLIFFLAHAIFINLTFYESIFVDSLQGMMLFYIIYLIINEDDKKYKNIALIVSFIILTMIKSSGFMFSITGLTFYYVYTISKDIFDKKKHFIKGIFTNKMIYIILFSIVVPFWGWKIWCHMHPVIDNPVYYYEPVRIKNEVSITGGLKSLVGAITGYGYDDVSTVIHKSVDDLLDKASDNGKAFYSSKPFPMTPLTWISLITILLFVLKILHKKDKAINDSINANIISYIMAFAVYIFLLVAAYTYAFGIEEALRHASSHRYIGAFLLSGVILVITLYLKYFKVSNRLLMIMLLIVLMFTPITTVSEGTIFAGARNWRLRGYEANCTAMASVIAENVNTDKKVVTINQTVNNFGIKVSYWAAPVRVYQSLNIDEEHLKDDFISYLNNYDYVAVIESDDLMNNYIYDYLDITLEDWTLYKVESSNLIKVKSIEIVGENN